MAELKPKNGSHRKKKKYTLRGSIHRYAESRWAHIKLMGKLYKKAAISLAFG